MKILSVVGARPNFVKIASIDRAIKEHNTSLGKPVIEHVIVHTGQHYSENMSQSFFDELDIPPPHHNLEVGSGTYGFQVGEMMKRLEAVFSTEKPDAVLVVGDVNSTVAAAVVASQMRIRVIHVEAGLRSFDRTMPEEINRVLTDAVSDVLFVTEESAVGNLIREGIQKEKIHFAGNVMIDTLLLHLKKAEQSGILETLGLMDNSSIRPYCVLTLHRPSNVDSEEVMGRLLDAMNEIARTVPIFFPVHPRTRARIAATDIYLSERIRLMDPLSYLDFMRMISAARLVLTDSGGIQEETTVLGVPCLTLRENTERPVTIREGTNQLVGRDPYRIIIAAKEILGTGMSKKKLPQLWDGKAAQRVIRILADMLGALPDKNVHAEKALHHMTSFPAAGSLS